MQQLSFLPFSLIFLYFLFLGKPSSSQKKVSVVKHNGRDYSYYKANGFTVILSPWFQIGFIGMDSLQDYLNYYAYQKKTLGPLLEKGELRGEMFYRNEKPNKSKARVFGYADSLYQEFDSIEKYQENITKILWIEKPTYSKNFDTLYLYLSSTNSLYEDGWGSSSIFLLKVINPKGHKELPIEEFIKGSTNSNLKFQWYEI